MKFQLSLAMLQIFLHALWDPGTAGGKQDNLGLRRHPVCADGRIGQTNRIQSISEIRKKCRWLRAVQNLFVVCLSVPDRQRNGRLSCRKAGKHCHCRTQFGMTQDSIVGIGQPRGKLLGKDDQLFVSMYRSRSSGRLRTRATAVSTGRSRKNA